MIENLLLSCRHSSGDISFSIKKCKEWFPFREPEGAGGQGETPTNH